MTTSDSTLSSSSMGTGTLWLVPTPLDFGTEHAAPLEQTIPQGVIEQAVKITHWVVENAKTARAVLKRFGEIYPLVVPLQEMEITELPRDVHKKGDAGFDAKFLLAPAVQGHDVGLMSEAGLPAIADPGASVVRAAHDLHICVQPMIGPSSILLALIASGLNGQNFAFVGYLPVPNDERTARIKELEKLTLRTGQTQLFIETPYRNEAMMRTLLTTLAPNVRLSVNLGMTLPQGWQASMNISQWRQAVKNEWKNMGEITPEVWKLPAVFAIGR